MKTTICLPCVLQRGPLMSMFVNDDEVKHTHHEKDSMEALQKLAIKISTDGCSAKIIHFLAVNNKDRLQYQFFLPTDRKRKENHCLGYATGISHTGLSFLVDQGPAGSPQNAESRLVQTEQKEQEMIVLSARLISIKTISGSTMAEMYATLQQAVIFAWMLHHKPKEISFPTSFSRQPVVSMPARPHRSLHKLKFCI
ncbi:hypothetical protein PoB_007380100 [Plakobranchus ocellatus]|uniref:Uncharacterized protein n=1 Tax=Plakobranchus ocellatus TaxID=259542 RepID=A0AAV4DTX2_9GAST|nr:hypothetical protein PoB_007380100 [Plakobranchus ocellatus]